MAGAINGFLTTLLLAFAGAAVFVGAFIIFNTFSITVAQRTREFAMLRTIGASRRQVLRSVLLEALLVGLVASVLGILAGIGFAKLMNVAVRRRRLRPADGVRSRCDLRSVLLPLAVGTGVARWRRPGRRSGRPACRRSRRCARGPSCRRRRWHAMPADRRARDGAVGVGAIVDGVCARAQ